MWGWRARLPTQDQVTCHYSSIHPSILPFFFFFIFYFASLSVREHSQRVPLSPSPASILECRRSAWNGREPPSPWAGREREAREQTGEGDGRGRGVLRHVTNTYSRFAKWDHYCLQLPSGPYRHTHIHASLCVLLSLCVPCLMCPSVCPLLSFLPYPLPEGRSPFSWPGIGLACHY